MSHARQDRASLILAEMIAAKLASRPEWIDEARRNLIRWREPNATSPSLVRCYDEWLTLLDRPVEEVCLWLTDKGDRGQRLRQNSPFAGVLPPEVVWDVKRRVRDESSAA